MPQTLIPNPADGTYFFGHIEEKTVRGLLIPSGPIVLRRGSHSRKAGYGVRHIWARHGNELIKRGYNTESDVARFVGSIIAPHSPVYCEFNTIKNTRVSVVRNSCGMAVLEHRVGPGDSGLYSVVTAFLHRNPHGTRIGSVKPYKVPDEKDT